jgi:hypothetical protein
LTCDGGVGSALGDRTPPIPVGAGVNGVLPDLSLCKPLPTFPVRHASTSFYGKMRPARSRGKKQTFALLMLMCGNCATRAVPYHSE